MKSLSQAPIFKNHPYINQLGTKSRMFNGGSQVMWLHLEAQLASKKNAMNRHNILKKYSGNKVDG